jgi:hypothetical protein
MMQCRPGPSVDDHAITRLNGAVAGSANGRSRHPAATGTSGTSHLATEKILEEKRTYSTLFFHQEKSFHDHHVSWLNQ